LVERFGCNSVKLCQVLVQKNAVTTDQANPGGNSLRDHRRSSFVSMHRRCPLHPCVGLGADASRSGSGSRRGPRAATRAQPDGAFATTAAIRTPVPASACCLGQHRPRLHQPAVEGPRRPYEPNGIRFASSITNGGLRCAGRRRRGGHTVQSFTHFASVAILSCFGRNSCATKP
jgi:hypothetical protein